MRTLMREWDNLKTLSIVGMCKNAGKTTVLNRLLSLKANGEVWGLTSIGRDGESTDVVTGMMTPERRSPTGILYVIGKLTDYTMYGSYGSTFVNYAIMLNEDGVYIHDSSWRSSYGGSIYYNNGSHGCINTPFDQVAALYDLVSTGTKVVVYGS